MFFTRLTIYLGILISAIFYPVHGQQQGLSKLIDSYQDQEALKHAQWSLHAQYVESGEVLIAHNSHWSLAPASGLKLLTSAVALELLGEDFTFQTRLFYEGTVNAEGLLKGNLYLVGGGDPTLGSSQVKGSLSLDSLMAVWVEAVRSAGIKEIDGAVWADDFLLDRKPLPDYWNWIDIGNYYGAGNSALCINDNLYELIFEPAKVVGNPAKVLGTEPAIPGLEFINYMSTGERGSGDRGYIYCAPGQFTATLRGTIPAGPPTFRIKGSIPDPPLFAAQEFRRRLQEAGIAVRAEAGRLPQSRSYRQATLLHTITSPPVKDIVYWINKRSVNLYAEQMVKVLGLEISKEGSLDSGLKVITQFLEERNLPTDGLALYDGSGLSRSNMITTRTMSELLRYMPGRPTFESFYNSLGIAGDPDDISFFSSFGSGTPIAYNARIKSGLIARVRSHSGYLKDRQGRLIAFSFMANNYQGPLSRIDNMHRELMIKLAEMK